MPENTTKAIKRKGRRLYVDGKEIAEIRGRREWTSCGLVADYQVWQNGEMKARGFCWFADAVKWVHLVLRDAYR